MSAMPPRQPGPDGQPQGSPNGCGRQWPGLYRLLGEKGRLLLPHLHPAHRGETAHHFLLGG
jgi:hypothetical protein